MTLHPLRANPLCLALACGGEADGTYTDKNGILRDAQDCWADPVQVWEAYSKRLCASECGRVTEGREAECFEGRQELMEDVRDWWCVDTCAADICLKLFDQYLETCSEEDVLALHEQCEIGPEALYWDANNPDREWSPECTHW